MDIEEIRQAINIFDLAKSYGAEPRKESGEAVETKHNPLRIERSSSLKLYSSTNTWTDFGTRGGGSIIDFVMQAEGISMPEAIAKVKAIAGIDDSNYRPHNYAPQKTSYMSPDIIMKIWDQQPPITFDNGKKELLSIAPKYIFDNAAPEDIASFHEIVKLEKQSKSLIVLLKDELDIPRTLRYRRFHKSADRDNQGGEIKWYAQPGTQSSFLYTHIKDTKELYLIVEGTHDYLSAILCGYNVIAIPSSKFKIPDEVLKDKLCVFIDDDDGKNFMQETFDSAKCAKILFDHKEFKKVNKIKEAKDFSDYMDHFKDLKSFKDAIALQCDILAHDTYTTPINRLLRFGDLTDNIEPPSWMVKNILPCDGLIEIVGASGSYKSFLVLDLMYCISNGIEYHTRDVKCGTCVYVAGEGKTGAILRMRALERHYGEKAFNFWILPMPSNMMCPIEMDALASDIRSIAPDGVSMVMFDTLHRNSSGSKENSSDDFATILGNVDKYLKPYSKLVGYVHHTGKGEAGGKTGRGTSSRFGAMDTSLFIDLLDDKVAGLECMKQKDGEMFEPIGFNMNQIDLGMTDEYGEPTYSLYPTLHIGKLPTKKVANAENDDSSISDKEIAEQIRDYLLENGDMTQSQILSSISHICGQGKARKILKNEDYKHVFWSFKKGDKNAWLFTAIPKEGGGTYAVEEIEYEMPTELF